MELDSPEILLKVIFLYSFCLHNQLSEALKLFKLNSSLGLWYQMNVLTASIQKSFKNIHIHKHKHTQT